MRLAAVATLSAVLMGAAPLAATGQSLSEIFKRVNPAPHGGARGPDSGRHRGRVPDRRIAEGQSRLVRAGPLFNMAGEVIGIVSYILSNSGGSEGLGFAVTSNVTRRLLLEQKSFWSGMSGYLISGDLARVLNLPPPGTGLLVERIASGSPADRIGLRAGSVRATIGDADLIVGGDIILAVEDIPLADPESYSLVRRKVTNLPPGEPVTITILRAGMRLKLTGTADR